MKQLFKLNELEIQVNVESQDVKATLFAIAVLREKFLKYRDEWELLVQKAIDWIKGQLRNEVSQVEQLLQTVQKVVPQLVK